MSKFWLLLLLVAAFQFAHSYPAAEYELDETTNDEVRQFIGDGYFEDEGDDGDEERFKIKPGKVLDKVGKIVGKVIKQLKKVSAVAKLAMKKGAALLKKMGVKISPLKCEEKTCKSCVIFKIPTENSFCLTIRFMKTNIATYLVVAGEINRKSKFEEKLKLGNMPRCVNVEGFIGKVCMKGIEGHAKSSSGQANVNFCLGLVAEKFGVGAKLCGIYANKKVRVKVSPQLFPGATSLDGDIVKLDDNGEDATTLDVDEVEID
uniref:Putative conserved secreted protein n=1 Tax=Triatoma infestans TaxID=30076 RepID=A0A023FB86_TRIIF